MLTKNQEYISMFLAIKEVIKMENEYTIVTYIDDLKILSFLLESEKDSYEDKHYVKISKNKEKQLIEEQFCNAGSLYLKEIPSFLPQIQWQFPHLLMLLCFRHGIRH